MRKLLLFLLLFISLCAKAQYEDHYWEPNPYQYQSNMTVIGVITFNDVEQRSSSLELGAFCVDECRGSVITQYEETFDRYFVYMMIYGNHNDSITFRCYDHNMNLELDLTPETHIIFHSNDMVGGVIDPFVFEFQLSQHNISLEIIPEAGGMVNGEGIYNKYDTCFIQLNPSAGYQFDALVENGDTLTKQPHYSFIVMTDRHFTALFSEVPIYYQIEAKAEPEEGGVISGTGQYLEDETCTLTVTANQGYDYLGLYENDQLITDNTTYTFIADANRDFVAKFELQINNYQISAEITPENAGNISGLGVYEENDICNIEMTPNVGYYFVALKENGVTITEEPNYSFTVESNRHFVAEFAKQINYYEISAEVNPDNAGSITGLGLYQESDTCHLEMIPENGYEFVALKENGEIISEDPNYEFIVESDRHFTAEFALQEFTVSLSANPSDGGTVSGSGTYTYGATVYAIAVPNANYIFKNWTDENGSIITSNPQYVFEATQNTNLTANFEYTDAITEIDEDSFTIYPNPASDFITIETLNALESDVVIYDLTGKIIIRKFLHSGDNKIDVKNINSGIYVISINGLKSKLIIQ